MFISLAQYTFQDLKYNAPFFLTYISTALFSFYLPIYALRQALARLWVGSSQSSSSDMTGAASTRLARSESLGAYAPVDEVVATADAAENKSSPRAIRLQIRVPQDEDPTEPVEGIAMTAPPAHVPLTVNETAQLSLLFFFIWFVQNLLFNVSLQLTSVSSNTILSSTSSLFTIVWSCVCLAQACKWLDFLAVITTIVGVCMVSFRGAFFLLHHHRIMINC